MDDPNYRLVHGKCLYYSQAAYHFMGARRLCKEKGGKLYEPKDLDEIKDFPDWQKPGWAWIGITGINITTGGNYVYNGKRLVDYFGFLI